MEDRTDTRERRPYPADEDDLREIKARFVNGLGLPLESGDLTNDPGRAILKTGAVPGEADVGIGPEMPGDPPDPGPGGPPPEPKERRHRRRR